MLFFIFQVFHLLTKFLDQVFITQSTIFFIGFLALLSKTLASLTPSILQKNLFLKVINKARTIRKQDFAAANRILGIAHPKQISNFWIETCCRKERHCQSTLSQILRHYFPTQISVAYLRWLLLPYISDTNFYFHNFNQAINWLVLYNERHYKLYVEILK